MINNNNQLKIIYLKISLTKTVYIVHENYVNIVT